VTWSPRSKLIWSRSVPSCPRRSGAIEALLWERDHGLRKRVAVVVDILEEVGWREQVVAATTGDPGDAPRLDEDAAMMLVDQVLLVSEGSAHACIRDEMRAAFAYLTSPLVQQASYTDDDCAIVIDGGGMS